MDISDQRERILSSAAWVMGEVGMDGVTVRAVAAAAGVGMGTLRHYFPTQRELHVAVVQSAMTDTLLDFDIGDTGQPAGDRLVRCVLQFLPEDTAGQQSLDVWFGLYRYGLEPGGSGGARSFLEVAARSSYARITGWLEQLAGEGAIEPHRVKESVLLLSALVSGACLEILTPGSAMSIGAARDMLARTARSLVVKDHS